MLFVLLGGGRGGFPMDLPFVVRLSGGGLVVFLAPPPPPPPPVVPVVLLLNDFCFALMREKSTKKVSVSYASNEDESASLSATKRRYSDKHGEKRERARERKMKRFFLILLPRRGSHFSNFTRAKKPI